MCVTLTFFSAIFFFTNLNIIRRCLQNSLVFGCVNAIVQMDENKIERNVFLQKAGLWLQSL